MTYFGARRASASRSALRRSTLNNSGDVLSAPSSTALSSSRNAFRSSTKPEIAAAVEGLFDVKVVAVNTLRRDGKLKRFRGFLGRRNETKKAMVTLQKGQSIDVTAGI